MLGVTLSPMLKWIAGGLLIVCLVLGLALSLERRHSHKLAERNAQLVELRKADRAAYERGQAEAHENNIRTVEKIKAEQEKITDEVTSDLGARLELIRRELRTETAKGSTDRAPISAEGQAPCRAYDPAWLCVAPEDRLRAAENEERHDQLITFEERQQGVNPND